MKINGVMHDLYYKPGVTNMSGSCAGVTPMLENGDVFELYGSRYTQNYTVYGEKEYS